MHYHRHYQHKHFAALDKLWVVTTVFNSPRYKTRYDLYRRFEQMCKCAGVNLMTVEVAFGDRPFEVTEATNPNNVQLRTWDELWQKERSLNVAVSRLPADWEMVMIADADIFFLRPDWAEETVHQLQHNMIVQNFQSAVDLGPNGEVLKTFESFMYSFVSGRPLNTTGKYWQSFHPGYCWSFRREAWDFVGGLLDHAILGAADQHMAWALIGKVEYSLPKGYRDLPSAYLKHLKIWEQRANDHIRLDVGYVKGTIVHGFHGKKKDRKYADRWRILIDNNFDPELDLKNDWQSLHQFSHAGERLRGPIRGYFHARNEDSIDL